MFRPMRRHAQQLDRAECEEILERAPRGVLSVLGDGGYPYGVPLDFVLYQGHIYFHCAIEGHKLDAIDSCDKASFCVLDEGHREEGSWWYHFRSVIAFGRVRRIGDEARMHEVLRALGGKYFPPDEDIEADIARNRGRTVVLELTIEHLSGKRVREK